MRLLVTFGPNGRNKTENQRANGSEKCDQRRTGEALWCDHSFDKQHDHWEEYPINEGVGENG